MVEADPVAREVDCRVVYAGPEGAGKTANLEYLHQALDPDRRGKLISPSGSSGRSFHFDFLAVELGSIGSWHVRLHLYTAPGGRDRTEDRVRILRGADALVLVVDSGGDRLEANRDALDRLAEDLDEAGRRREELVTVFQYNKRDRGDALPVEELQGALNPGEAPYFEAVARRGDGVVETVEEVGYRVVRELGLGAPEGEP